jgi:hypothetical protein
MTGKQCPEPDRRRRMAANYQKAKPAGEVKARSPAGWARTGKSLEEDPSGRLMSMDDKAFLADRTKNPPVGGSGFRA